MVPVALFVRLEAKPCRDADVESFLPKQRLMVKQEPATTMSFSVRCRSWVWGAFLHETSQQRHRSVQVASAVTLEHLISATPFPNLIR